MSTVKKLSQTLASRLLIKLAPVLGLIGHEIHNDRRHLDMMQSAYTGWPNTENSYAWEDLIRRKSSYLMHGVTRLYADQHYYLMRQQRRWPWQKSP
jgi:hypothetical protein